ASPQVSIRVQPSAARYSTSGGGRASTCRKGERSGVGSTREPPALAPALRQHVVVGRELRLAVAVGGTVATLRLAIVASAPLDGDGDREPDRGDLAHRPRDPAAVLLVVERGDAP